VKLKKKNEEINLKEKTKEKYESILIRSKNILKRVNK
jgi:hypothetical protein